jgi:hypothetical protein
LVSEPDSCLYISGKGGIRCKEYSDTLREFGIRARTLFVYFKQREKAREARGGKHSDTHIKWYQSRTSLVYFW